MTKLHRHVRTLLQLILVCAAILLLWQSPNVMSRFGVYLLTRILFMGLMAMSVNLLMGFGGLTSLAQGRLCRNRRLRLCHLPGDL